MLGKGRERGEAGKVWVVVVLAEVGEDDVVCCAVKFFAQKACHVVVGEMTKAATDALFEFPGVGAGAEEVTVVVGLEDKGLAVSEVVGKVRWEVAQVGDDGEFSSCSRSREDHGFGCIVGDGDGGQG